MPRKINGRPDLTSALLDPSLRLLRLFPRLHRWAVARVQARHLGQGLSLRQLAVLSAIRDGLSSPGQVARRLRVTPAVVTGLVDRMERRGYVRREAEVEDRRRLRLVLTETGLAVGLEIQQALAEELATQLVGASPTEVKELNRSLELMERTLVTLERLTPTAPEEGPDEEPEEDDSWRASSAPPLPATKGGAAKARRGPGHRSRPPATEG